MPILAPSVETTATGAPVVDESVFYAWKSASGNITALADEPNGYYVTAGATGLGSQPYTLLRADSPARGGAIDRGSRTAVRELFIPIAIIGVSRAQLLATYRALVADIDPRDGLGELQVFEADGTARRIPCFYAGGMEGNEGLDVAGSHWRVFGLTFLAYDPAFLDMNDVTQSWSYQPPVPFFPLLPPHLSSSTVLGDVTITNPGDEPAYPIWTINGPADVVRLSNYTTNSVWEMSTSITDTTTVTVDTRPDFLSVRDQSGTNLWPTLAPNPELWQLRPGDNAVTLSVGGSGAGTTVTLTYTPRYKSA